LHVAEKTGDNYDFDSIESLLINIEYRLNSTSSNWRLCAINDVINLCKTEDQYILAVIVQSKAFERYSTMYFSEPSSLMMKAYTNIISNSQEITAYFIQEGLLSSLYECLLSNSDENISSSLNCLYNISISSLFSRLCMICTHFVDIALVFLTHYPKLKNVQLLSKLSYNLLSYFLYMESLDIEFPLSYDHISGFDIEYLELLMRENVLCLFENSIYPYLNKLLHYRNSSVAYYSMFSLLLFVRQGGFYMFMLDTSIFEDCAILLSYDYWQLHDIILRFLITMGIGLNGQCIDVFDKYGLFNIVFRLSYNSESSQVRSQCYLCICNYLSYDVTRIENYITNSWLIEMDDRIKNFVFSEKSELISLLANVIIEIPIISSQIFQFNNIVEAYISILFGTDNGIIEIILKSIAEIQSIKCSSFQVLLNCGIERVLEEVRETASLKNALIIEKIISLF